MFRRDHAAWLATYFLSFSPFFPFPFPSRSTLPLYFSPSFSTFISFSSFYARRFFLMFPARYDSYLTSLFFFFLSLSLSLSLSRTILALHSLQCERSHGLLVTETTATVTHGVPTLVTMAEAEVMASVVVASVEVASVVVATVVVVTMVVLVVVVEWWGCW